MRLSARGEVAWLRYGYDTGTSLLVVDTAGERALDTDPQLTALGHLRLHGQLRSGR